MFDCPDLSGTLMALRAWNFVAITWQTSARAEISASAGAKYKIVREESRPENRNGAKNTNRENWGTLLFSQFGLLAAPDFQFFGLVFY